MPVRVVQFLAIVLGALALVPSGAHLAAYPNKLGLSRDAYFAVQGIYAGWWVLGMLWIAALVMNAALALMLREQPGPARLAALAAASFALMLGIFFGWTQPANHETANWTFSPENWPALRAQWEYSHLANAVLAFLALCLTTGSVLSGRPNGRPAG